MKQYIDMKSEWQKDDCLVCSNESRFEVVSNGSRIRFCGSLDCLDAIKLILLKTEKEDEDRN